MIVGHFMKEYEYEEIRSSIKSKTKIWRPPLLILLILVLVLVFLFFLLSPPVAR